MSYLPCCGRLLAVAALERLSPFSSMGVLDTAEREMLLLALVSTGFPNFWGAMAIQRVFPHTER